jgi:hypothetical protein
MHARSSYSPPTPSKKEPSASLHEPARHRHSVIDRRTVSSPVLDNNHDASPSVFVSSALLREAHGPEDQIRHHRKPMESVRRASRLNYAPISLETRRNRLNWKRCSEPQGVLC